MKQVHITFSGADIQLEGIWHLPEAGQHFPAVIVCHPHPLYGGNMSNNVVIAICQALVKQSIAAFRFNFRGVGSSGGEHGGGTGEQDDLRAALALVIATPDIDSRRVGLAGYSFGTVVALPVAAETKEVSLLALVSPALSDAGWTQLKAYTRPVFLISGENDLIVSPEQLCEYIEDMPALKQCEVIAGADHFWQGYEMEVASKVARFFSDGFTRA